MDDFNSDVSPQEPDWLAENEARIRQLNDASKRAANRTTRRNPGAIGSKKVSIHPLVVVLILAVLVWMIIKS